ncbi:MAG: ribonuclease III [Myxococcota bacterium]
MRDGDSKASHSELQTALGYTFEDASLLHRALTHTSYVNELGGGEGPSPALDNERLEFLGDAVLQLAVSEWLFERFPDVSEGALTQRRAAIVNADALAEVGRTLDLGELLRVGVGEERTGGRARASNLADAVEALLGALFLDGGYLAANAAVRRVFVTRVEHVMSGPTKGPKSRLQEYMQAHHQVTPVYGLVQMTGPAHSAHFICEVQIPGIVSARGEGGSKKDAEKAAAQRALDELKLS